MIYKDPEAQYDKPNYPAVRQYESCLNCGRSAFGHTGWECNDLRPQGQTPEAFWVNLPPERRYITASMAKSVGIAVWYPPNGSPIVLTPAPASAPPPTPPQAAKPITVSAAHSLAPQFGFRPGDTFRIDNDRSYLVIDDIVAKPETDTSKWQAWRHNTPGECACGIPRERCDYHR